MLTVSKLVRYIPYACIMAFCIITLIIGTLLYTIYYTVKVAIYNQSFYLPASENINEIKRWIKENINGHVWIEEDIHREEILMIKNSPEILHGWVIRFTNAGDAMAFKLVWTNYEQKI